MNLNQTNAFIKRHGILLPNGQVLLTKPLYVFKKVFGYNAGRDYSSRTDSIANLVIPIGAVVNLAQNTSRKLRASQAYCHSIVSKNGKQQFNSGESWYVSSFKYKSGIRNGVQPKQFKNMVIDKEKYESNWGCTKVSACKVTPSSFDTTSTEECSAGVHFFLELNLAKNY